MRPHSEPHFSELFDLGGVAAIVAAAAETGLLARLAPVAQASSDFARALALDPEATGLALDVLASTGFARRTGRGYAASPALEAARRAFGDGRVSPEHLWRHFSTFLKTGERFTLMDSAPASRGTAYVGVVGGLATLFDEVATALADRLDAVDGAMLDVGAGSGVWSLAMARRSPTATVTAVDLPAVIPQFLAHAAANGLGDRVSGLEGDYFSLPVPRASYDRVLLANVLHLEPPERARALVARWAAALRPGGSLIVIDALACGSGARDRARAVYAIHLAMRTAHGKNHPREHICTWLADAGLPMCRLVMTDAQPAAFAAFVATRAP